jgi:hypothetical protein
MLVAQTATGIAGRRKRMTMTAAIAHSRISRELREAELALNDALLKQSQLFTSMIAARHDVDVSVFTGQQVLMRLNKSQQELLSSGGNLARVHGGLLEIGREVAGASDDCPDNWRKIAQSDSVVAA